MNPAAVPSLCPSATTTLAAQHHLIEAIRCRPRSRGADFQPPGLRLRPHSARSPSPWCSRWSGAPASALAATRPGASPARNQAGLMATLRAERPPPAEALQAGEANTTQLDSAVHQSAGAARATPASGHADPLVRVRSPGAPVQPSGWLTRVTWGESPRSHSKNWGFRSLARSTLVMRSAARAGSAAGAMRVAQGHQYQQLPWPPVSTRM